mgnify:CR=1 FL=1
MTREQLKERVRRLPMQPGVYMHKDKTGRVIYVGKAKLLRNRVANYFQPPERLTPKRASSSAISTPSTSLSPRASSRHSCSKIR